MDDFVAQCRARIEQMNHAAGDVTKALGLPDTAKYTVLATLYEPRHEATAQTDEQLKALIYQRVEGFLNIRMKTQLAAFHSLWDVLKALPVDALAQPPARTPRLSGIGFADRSHNLPAIISTISWAIVQSQRATGNVTEEALLQEALDRGCSGATSIALTEYIQQYL